MSAALVRDPAVRGRVGLLPPREIGLEALRLALLRLVLVRGRA